MVESIWTKGPLALNSFFIVLLSNNIP